MKTLLERYKAGEHLAVCRELEAVPDHPEAAAVAAELMRRVRANLETLVKRWRSHGFTLAAPVSKRGTAADVMDELEESAGPLPVTLRALYQEFEFIDFIEPLPPRDDGWPAEEHHDPLSVYPLGEDLDESLQPDEEEEESYQLRLWPDSVMKSGHAGVGDVYTLLPGDTFDTPLSFEGSPLTDELATLLSYLRSSILEHGGCGVMAEGRGLARALERELIEGLIPF